MKQRSAVGIIEGIEKKIARIMADNRRLRDEKEKLEASRSRLRDENARLAARTAELERRVAVLELREGFAAEAADTKSVKAAKAQVNRLMREVDRCLELLGGPE